MSSVRLYLFSSLKLAHGFVNFSVIFDNSPFLFFSTYASMQSVCRALSRPSLAEKIFDSSLFRHRQITPSAVYSIPPLSFSAVIVGGFVGSP